MTLEEINALRAMTFDELIDEARRLGVSVARDVIDPDTGDTGGVFVTKDAIRLKIIDATIDRELGEGEPGRPPPDDPGVPTR